MCIRDSLTGSSAVKCSEYETQQMCLPTTIKSTLPQCGDLSNHKNLFVVLGDYGLPGSTCSANVANLVHQLESQYGTLDFIATLGDNAYWNGQCSQVHEGVAGYEQYIHNGSHVACTDPVRRTASSTYRFFPSIGNHDWDTPHKLTGALPYLQYFNYLPALGNGGMYYNKRISPQVELFALNSNNYLKANGNYNLDSDGEAMKAWLQQALAASTSTFKIVYFHHPPYSTAQHDDLGVWMRWPFKQWGASVVMTGHQHAYERLNVDGMQYIVNGLGGHHWVYRTANMTGTPTCDVADGSQLRYNAAHGAMLGVVDRAGKLRFCFYSTENGGKLVDQFTVTHAACVDHVPECALWATDGQCYENRAYMDKYCCHSCTHHTTEAPTEAPTIAPSTVPTRSTSPTSSGGSSARTMWIVLGVIAGCLLVGGLGWYWYSNRHALQTMYASLAQRPECPSNLDEWDGHCLLYTSPSPRDRTRSRMPSSA
eukprot:TRINITY_DN894_c0_g1_i6.p1 TRINITY_DN894_c0_g1~~TRINITY_DN894_c0_g1_i6.p1  ORF type:complete len:482 (-),score=103.85 TRINITY_DN894_c0_g1_i6:95-1540(-)